MSWRFGLELCSVGWCFWSRLGSTVLSKVKVAQLCPTICNPTDCIVHGILQARILEWAAFPFSRSNPGLLHCRQILLPAEPQVNRKNTGVGNLSFLQGNFPTQESNWGLLICRWILYRLSYQGSPVGCLLLLLLLLSRFSRVRLSATP